MKDNVCMCVYFHVYVPVCVYTCLYLCACMHVYWYMYVHISIRWWIPQLTKQNTVFLRLKT